MKYKELNYQMRFISLPEELGEEIEAKVEYSVQNDSIGSYEYWGFQCYDTQPDYLQLENVTPVFTDEHTPEMRILIEEWIEANKDAVYEDAEQQLTFECDDRD